MIPGLPAHILFMCVRYADSLNDADMLKSLMNSTISGIKQVVKVGTTFLTLDLSIMAILGTFVEMTRCPDFSHPLSPVFGQPHDSSNQSEAQSVKDAKLLEKDNLGQTALRVGHCQLHLKSLPVRLQPDGHHPITSVSSGVRFLTVGSICLST